MKTLLITLLLGTLAAAADAQSIDDGIMIARRGLFTGNLYTYDRWDQYWEGTLKRGNGNLGTITTQTNVWSADYGVTDRLNVIATVPYVWTRASQGVLRPMSGIQDLTLAAKYAVLEKPAGRLGAVRLIGVAAAGVPLTNYTPDYQPLSIGTASKRVSGRFTANVQSNPGWYLNVSTAYTWRADITLDRPYYYTDGQLFLTDQVSMPNTLDYVASGGYMNGGLMATLSYSQQKTLGGGDIRRQDFPFVSNQVNVSRIGGLVMAQVPKVRSLMFELAYAYVVDGRNVGQSSTVTTGLLYRYRGASKVGR